MHIKLIALLGLLNFSLMASPVLEPKPDNPYLVKFQPVESPSYSRLILRKGDRLAICGDSITEQRMYSRLMEDYLTMCVPQLNISVRQNGWAGEKASGFLARMTNDCLRFKPTIATTSFGMNDFQYCPYQDSLGRAYYTNSLDMISAFKAHGARVILGSPGCISRVPPWETSPDYTLENLNLSLCEFRNSDVSLAKQERVRFADVFWPMLTANFMGRQEYGTNYAIPGRDGVHPYWAGHLIMAYAYLKAMGLDGNIGTFTIDLKDNRIKVSKGHRVISAKDGEFTIESSRYPFCGCEPVGEGNPPYPAYGRDDLTSNNNIRSGMTLVPFNEQLNRLMLVVKNATAKNYEITWGDQTKTFAASQLADGINLAAEFPKNPFGVAFAKVDAAIADKEAYETKEIKEIFHLTDGDDVFTQAVAVRTDKNVGQSEKERDALVAAVYAAFVPVTHVIKITPQ